MDLVQDNQVYWNQAGVAQGIIVGNHVGREPFHHLREPRRMLALMNQSLTASSMQISYLQIWRLFRGKQPITTPEPNQYLYSYTG